MNTWATGNQSVPMMLDRGVMALCRQELGRTLTELEKFFMRSEFKRIAKEIAEERHIG